MGLQPSDIEIPTELARSLCFLVLGETEVSLGFRGITTLPEYVLGRGATLLKVNVSDNALEALPVNLGTALPLLESLNVFTVHVNKYEHLGLRKTEEDPFGQEVGAADVAAGTAAEVDEVKA